MIVLEDSREHISTRRGHFIDQQQQRLGIRVRRWVEREAAGRRGHRRGAPAGFRYMPR